MKNRDTILSNLLLLLAAAGVGLLVYLNDYLTILGLFAGCMLFVPWRSVFSRKSGVDHA